MDHSDWICTRQFSIASAAALTSLFRASCVPSTAANRCIVAYAHSQAGKLSQNEISSDNPGGLKGSMQHWLAVYPPEFQIPMFFVAVD
jgi:hypothetical protein